MGSSPRVRGTRLHHPGSYTSLGIIPACAGNTYRTRRMGAPARDHPRVCGEHNSCGLARQLCQGSSPRVRGTPLLIRNAFEWDGIIPACAGNTATTVRGVYQGRDHPRVCGEHFEPATFCSIQTGSSPRVRGTREDSQSLRSAGGIIPACAGNTTRSPPRYAQAWDHPRVCGEH